MIQKRKILIYDNNQFYFKYFKKIFFEYDFKVFFEEDIEDDLIDAHAVIFIMERSVEFIEFLKIYNKGVSIVFGCFDRSFYIRRDEISSLYGINVIDISGTKMDIRDQVDAQLQLLKI